MKASVYIATTLEGYIARKDGSLDWLPGSDGNTDAIDGNDYGYNAFMESIDVMVMGRNTYEQVLLFGQWPYANKRVIVYSTKLRHLAPTLPDSVEIRSCSAIELYQNLQASGAHHLYIDGGKTIQTFLDAGLINFITITRVPILIGSGIPLFGKLHQDIQLTHLKTESFDNGFVQNKYEIARC